MGSLGSPYLLTALALPLWDVALLLSRKTLASWIDARGRLKPVLITAQLSWLLVWIALGLLATVLSGYPIYIALLIGVTLLGFADGTAGSASRLLMARIVGRERVSGLVSTYLMYAGLLTVLIAAVQFAAVGGQHGGTSAIFHVVFGGIAALGSILALMPLAEPLGQIKAPSRQIHDTDGTLSLVKDRSLRRLATANALLPSVYLAPAFLAMFIASGKTSSAHILICIASLTLGKVSGSRLFRLLDHQRKGLIVAVSSVTAIGSSAALLYACLAGMTGSFWLGMLAFALIGVAINGLKAIESAALFGFSREGDTAQVFAGLTLVQRVASIVLSLGVAGLAHALGEAMAMGTLLLLQLMGGAAWTLIVRTPAVR
ncbi:hypothetical protein [Spiribacter onubensis]|uniref:MFS transporter n=1 Tax=Spiribacter onubensis TaxID=3122420 RepID=A0ABV3S792_9GAMM